MKTILKKWGVVFIINAIVLILYCMVTKNIYSAAFFELFFLVALYVKFLRNLKPIKDIEIDNGDIRIQGIFSVFKSRQNQIISVRCERSLIAKIFDWDKLTIITQSKTSTLYMKHREINATTWEKIMTANLL